MKMLSACGLAAAGFVGLAMSAGAQVTDVLQPMNATRLNTNAVTRFETALPAVDGPFQCHGPEQVQLPSLRGDGPMLTSFFATFPHDGDYSATVDVMMDSTGTLVRSAERRGPPIPAIPPNSMPPGQLGKAVAAAAAATRTTMISIDYLKQSAIVGNRGGGIPDTSLMVPNDVVASMEKFGHPIARAELVLQTCREQAQRKPE